MYDAVDQLHPRVRSEALKDLFARAIHTGRLVLNGYAATPSPLMGEGWGEGDISKSSAFPPLPRGERGLISSDSAVF